LFDCLHCRAVTLSPRFMSGIACFKRNPRAAVQPPDCIGNGGALPPK
jgi:hypothetical protein